MYWEGFLRIGAFFLLGGYGYFGGAGLALVGMGLVDLAFGLVYLVGLPRALKATHADLLLDRVK